MEANASAVLAHSRPSINIRELSMNVPDCALGRGMRVGGDGVVRDLLAKEQHGQRLSRVLNKKRTCSHHIWQKRGCGNSPTSSADTCCCRPAGNTGTGRKNRTAIK